jgi:hypothetical protein
MMLFTDYQLNTNRNGKSIMEMKINYTISIVITEPTLNCILKAFVKTIKPYFCEIVKRVLEYFALEYFNNGELLKMLVARKVTKKTFSGRQTTSITTPFGVIKLPQYQVTVDGKKRRNITRLLLGIEKWKRIPLITSQYLGLMGALAPLRVVNKFAGLLCGIKFSLMAIVRAMRISAKNVKLGIDEGEQNVFEADGTGVPILRSGKRGRELKVLAQRKRKGGIRIAGMTIGAYSQEGWERLFAPLKGILKKFKEIFLVTDGDTSPLDSLKGLTVILQRCLFHIAHEVKYTLWEDGVKRKSDEWRTVLARTLEITMVKRIHEDEAVCAKMIAAKKEKLCELILWCEEQGFSKTTAFLKNASGDIFSGIEKRIGGGTTSLIERVMRTVNQRINVSKWSEASALSVAVLRGAYYYNGYDI